MRHAAILAAGLVIGLAITTRPASAEDPDFLGNYQDWNAFAGTEGGNKYCYIGSVPQKEEGDYTKRGETFALVTHRPAEDATGVVSIRAGYTYKEGSEVTVTIGGNEFRLFTDDGHAWSYDSDADRKLVGAMKRGLDMIVKGTSSRGTLTTDTYSLRGFTAAYKAISEACGVN